MKTPSATSRPASLLPAGFRFLTGAVLITWLVLPLVPLGIWSFAPWLVFSRPATQAMVDARLGVHLFRHSRSGRQPVDHDLHIGCRNSAFGIGRGCQRDGHLECTSSVARRSLSY